MDEPTTRGQSAGRREGAVCVRREFMCGGKDFIFLWKDELPRREERDHGAWKRRDLKLDSRK